MCAGLYGHPVCFEKEFLARTQFWAEQKYLGHCSRVVPAAADLHVNRVTFAFYYRALRSWFPQSLRTTFLDPAFRRCRFQSRLRALGRHPERPPLRDCQRTFPRDARKGQLPGDAEQVPGSTLQGNVAFGKPVGVDPGRVFREIVSIRK